MQNRISEAFELAKKQLQIAENFFRGEDIDNALIYVWNCFENLINCLKDNLNNRPVYDHKPKVDVLREFFLRRIINRDYHPTFSKLITLRLVAEFGPYTKIPKTYNQQDVENYIKEAKMFLEEVKVIAQL